MNLKEQSKIILNGNPEITTTYVLFVIGFILVNLPELLLKTVIKIFADKVDFKWLKLIVFLIDIPIAITIQIVAVVLLFAIQYYVFLKASGKRTSFKSIFKEFKLVVLFKFIVTLFYSAVAFLLCQIPTILLGCLYFIYSALKFITEAELSPIILICYFCFVILSFLFFTVLFIKRFGLVLYIFLYNPARAFGEILRINKFIYQNGKQEFNAMIKSYAPMLLLSVMTCGIYLFYFIPSIQISLILFVKSKAAEVM